MDTECYGVEVIHFINPYFVWVRVKDSRGKFKFEQIGVYGVLPVEVSLDLAENKLVAGRCTQWVPAALLLMKNIFASAVEVLFCPILDRLNSIFDDGTHKFGEIIIKQQKDGDMKFLSEVLEASSFSIHDEKQYEIDLDSGKIAGKLPHEEIKNVAKVLERVDSKAARKQLEIFYAAQDFEASLTVKNIEAHNKRSKDEVSIDAKLKMKLDDFEKCKNADLEPIRVCSRMSNHSTVSSASLLKMRLSKTQVQPAKSNSQLTEENVRFFNAQNARGKTDVVKLSNYQKALSDDFDDVQPKNETKLVKNEEILSKERFPKVDVDRNKVEEKIGDDFEEGRAKINDDVDFTLRIDNTNEAQVVKKKKSKKQTSSPKIPEYDPDTERRVAYGPPDMNITKMSMKIVKKTEFVDNYTSVVKTEEVPQKKKEDDFGDVDSECEDFEVPKTNVDVKNETKDSNVCGITSGRRINFTKRFKRFSEGKNAKIDNNKESVVKKDPKSDLEFEKGKKITKDDIFDGIVNETIVKVAEVSKHCKTDSSKLSSIRLRMQKLGVCDTAGKTRNVENTQNDVNPQISKLNLNTLRQIRSRQMMKYLSSKQPNISNLDVSKDSDVTLQADKVLNSTPLKGFAQRETDLKTETVSSEDESMNEVLEQINKEYKPIPKPQQEQILTNLVQIKNNVNPFRNVDPNISVFVDKLVTPVLMVHSKIDKRFVPIFKLRDVPFTIHIQVILKNMGIEEPMTIQKISWGAILRGYSTFLVSPKNSGKTMGYLPAVCRLIADHDLGIDGNGPCCIIVCATSNSVSEVERLARIFLGSKERVLAFFPCMSELEMTTALLNGCELLVSTPSILVRLLQLDFGVDLRRLTTFVLDDCERLSEVYANEIKLFLFKIKEMLKNRIVKEVKVQYVLASRIWCDFMEPLAKKAPDTVICIGAFQECVLYSKANTTASFVAKENKVKSVLDFLKQIDKSKRTVIVCRTDEEIKTLERALSKEKYAVLASDSTMTVQDLYNLQDGWNEYREPIIGPILLCCDGNLAHLNVTDAHYLVHYSLPSLFSAFCKRFSALNENYASFLKTDNQKVKIKILLEESNVEQLPKILHFIKRCTTEVPNVLDDVCERVLASKDLAKGRKLVPICDSLMALGECPDFWNCQERHTIIKEDEPNDWVPKDGVITFQIIHYHTAVLYSVRLLSNVTATKTVKYPQNYNMLAMKIAIYFGQESHRKLHGIPKVGDICAACINENLFMRCQVVKILSYYQKEDPKIRNPNYVLVRLLDKEKLETTRDVYLYHLPENMRTVETHTVQVRLANIRPKDKDITYSDLAKAQLVKITNANEDLYLRAKVGLTIGNCVFVETLETCKDLSLMSKTVVRHDFKHELLDKHAITNPDHLPRLEKLCRDAGLSVKTPETPIAVPQLKKLPKEQWAHLEKDDILPVFFTTAVDPSTFFVRLVKFEDSCNSLGKEIQKYVEQNIDNKATVAEGDIVLARLPDDGFYDRARVDKVIDDNKVECFFVDHGDWREVSKEHLIEITEKFITQLPFQAIECKLVGVKPLGQNWTEFATNWLTNCLQDQYGDPKQINVKYFTKEQAKYTGGRKYGVVLIDTNTEKDVVVNDLIMEMNLAQENDSEIGYLNRLEIKRVVSPKDNSDNEDIKWENVSKSSVDTQPQISPLKDIFLQKPIRSVPLVESDFDSDGIDDKWDTNMNQDFMEMFKPVQQKIKELDPKLAAIKDASKSSSEVSFRIEKMSRDMDTNLSQNKNDSSCSEASLTQRLMSSSDIEVIPSPKIKELDSDDLTSPDSTQISLKFKSEKSLDFIESEMIIDYESLRKPKVCWKQDKKTVTLKIMVIGAEKSDVKFEEKRLKVYAGNYDAAYGFDLELYGIIDTNRSKHSDKGQYILVTLSKVIQTNWLRLARSGVKLKWVVNDVDCIDVSTDDESDKNDHLPAEMIKNMCEEDSETEDEDMMDDYSFAYRR